MNRPSPQPRFAHSFGNTIRLLILASVFIWTPSSSTVVAATLGGVASKRSALRDLCRHESGAGHITGLFDVRVNSCWMECQKALCRLTRFTNVVVSVHLQPPCVRISRVVACAYVGWVVGGICHPRLAGMAPRARRRAGRLRGPAAQGDRDYCSQRDIMEERGRGQPAAAPCNRVEWQPTLVAACATTRQSVHGPRKRGLLCWKCSCSRPFVSALSVHLQKRALRTCC